jgi:RHS repeat-associated protein
VTSQTGCLSTDFSLPDYVSLGESRGLSFIYRSERADPQPIVPFDFTIPARAAVPARVSYRLTAGGALQEGEAFVSTQGLSENVDEALHGAVSLDAGELETGLYPYNVRITSHYLSTRVSEDISERLSVVNERQSPFGAGFGLVSLSRLHIKPDYVLLAEGGGSNLMFFPSSSKALRFDGSNDLVDVGGVASIPGAHTIEAWVRPLSPKMADMVMRGTFGGCQQGFALRTPADGRAHYIVDPPGCGGFGSGNVLSPGPLPSEWTHLAGSWDGSTARLYVNGSLQGQSGGAYAAGSRMTIGADTQLVGFFRGDLDEIRVWNRTLNQGEIQARLDQPLDGNEPGLVNYYRFEEGQGQLAFDSSITAKTAVLGLNLSAEPGDPSWIDEGAPLQCLSGGCSFISPRGDYSRLVKTTNGGYTRTLKDGTQIRFDAEGLQTSVADRNANTTAYAYDGGNRLTSITDPAGLVTTLTYSGNRLSAVTDPASRTTMFIHDGAGNLTEVRFPDGSTRKFAYDARHRMISEIDARGFTSQRQYDAAGRFVQATVADGAVRKVKAAQSVGLVDPASGLGTPDNPAPFSRPNQAISTFTDGEDRIRTVDTDSFGAAERITDAAGLITTTTRDADSNPTRTVLPNGSGFMATFDGKGNLLTRKDETLGGTDTFTYSQAFNQITSVKDSLNSITNVVYDSKGNPTSITTPAGRITQLGYDSRGLVTSLTDPFGTPRALSYDAEGNLAEITEGSGAEARSTQLSYTGAGYLDVLTDALGRTVDFDYDAQGRITRQILPDGRRISYAYDASGNLIELTPPSRPVHGFDYGPLDLESAYRPPAIGLPEHSTQYRYNKAQQLTRVIRPDGQTLHLNYDTGGRLSELSIPSPLAGEGGERGSYAYSYALNGNLATISAPQGQALNFAYNKDLLTGTTWSGAISGSVGFSYDLERRIISQSVNGSSLSFAYDKDDLLTQAGALTLTRNAQHGLVQGTALGNVNTSHSYNGFAELSQYSAANGANALYSATYARDKLGRITAKSETVQGTMTNESYEYDLAGRLMQVIRNGTTTTYAYDANGNRLSKTAGGNSQGGIYDDQDRLISYGSTVYSYTANGELKTKMQSGATTEYSYDALGNLIQTKLPGDITIDYLIDGQNRRIGKKANGTLVQGFLYQDQLEPIAELDGSGAVIARFIYADKANVPAYMLKGGKTYRIISDHLGSPRLVIEIGDGAVTQRIHYDEFGNITQDTNPGFQPFGFAGGIYDQHTGLVRFGTRDYDTETGRWTAKDPIRFEGDSFNLYGYVLADPINLIDPSGLLVPGLPGASSGLPTGPNICTFAPDLFPLACGRHDDCYGTPGTCRPQCDRKFYDDARAERPDLPAIIPAIYYGGVRVGGLPFYKAAQKKSVRP